MSATTISVTPSEPAAPRPKRSFRRRYCVARGTAYQVWGLLSGSALLALATQVQRGAGATALMLGGFIARLPAREVDLVPPALARVAASAPSRVAGACGAA